MVSFMEVLMEIKNLRYFLAVAREENMSIAPRISSTKKEGLYGSQK